MVRIGQGDKNAWIGKIQTAIPKGKTPITQSLQLAAGQVKPISPGSIRGQSHSNLVQDSTEKPPAIESVGRESATIKGYDIANPEALG
ncbi:MAG: hypothetical protein U1F68_11135 [Gammaproteobacteria bacterium]